MRGLAAFLMFWACALAVCGLCCAAIDGLFRRPIISDGIVWCVFGAAGIMLGAGALLTVLNHRRWSRRG